MQSYVDRGRSTPGETQQNEFDLQLRKPSDKSKAGKPKKSKQAAGQTDGNP